MKSLSVFAVLALLASSGTAFAQVPSYVEASPDIGATLELTMPGVGDYDLYESGVGIELQFRDWIDLPWGYALTLGYGSWSADKNAKRPGANLYDFDGELEVVPFGVSALYHAYSGESFNIVLDAGIRYYANDSKITARNSDQGGTKRYDVRIEDSIVFRGGVSADYALDNNMTWSFGIGYQVDIDNGSVSTELGPARNNVMEAFFLSTSIRMAL